MKLRVLLIALLSAAAALPADRHKLDIDPESDDGVLLQRIEQEPVADRKLTFLEQYVEQYPKTASIAWVYDQLLPIYTSAKQWDKVLKTAQGLLAIDADDPEAAYAALQAAEVAKDVEMIRSYALLTWDASAKGLQTPKPADPDEAADWDRQIEFATKAQAYAEYVLASQATVEPSLSRKTRLIEDLESRNRRSRYLLAVKQNMRVRTEANPANAFAIASRGIQMDPSNEDYLMVLANHYLSNEEDLDKALTYSLRVLEVLDKKSKPQGVAAEAWEKKKTQYVGGANWMAGVVYGKQARYGLSDRYLRAALPDIQSDAQLLAAALFYLGYDNYALAGQLRDKNRAVEAAGFSRRCLDIDGPFQPLAQKNLEALRNDFNIE